MEEQADISGAIKRVELAISGIPELVRKVEGLIGGKSIAANTNSLDEIVKTLATLSEKYANLEMRCTEMEKIISHRKPFQWAKFLATIMISSSFSYAACFFGFVWPLEKTAIGTALFTCFMAGHFIFTSGKTNPANIMSTFFEFIGQKRQTTQVIVRERKRKKEDEDE